VNANIPGALRRANTASSRKSAQKWRAFIQRSALHRMNSIFTLHVLAPHHGRRAVILLDAIVADQPATSQVTLQLRPRIGGRMLDIWPVDATPGELQVRLDSFAGVVRVAIPAVNPHRHPLSNRPLICEQAFGEALDPAKLERLGRYEVHLDRKLERCSPCCSG
jgi:hypothetical protein